MHVVSNTAGDSRPNPSAFSIRHAGVDNHTAILSVEGELDHGRGGSGAGPHGERRARGHVGVGPSVVESESERADDPGVGLDAVGPYRISNPGPGGLIFGYATVSERAIAEGVATLARVISEL